MTLDEYQQEQQRTANQSMMDRERLTVACLGLTGESGEVADHVKKWLGQGHVLDLNAVLRELGDVLYYVSEAAHSIGHTLQDVADANIAKLRERYPRGFEVERSVNRVAGNGG